MQKPIKNVLTSSSSRLSRNFQKPTSVDILGPTLEDTVGLILCNALSRPQAYRNKSILSTCCRFVAGSNLGTIVAHAEF